MVIKESRDCSWQELRSKSVEDSDGFLTDYTLYYDADIDSYMCIFGDKEVYNPDNTEPDWEGDDRSQADEWFDSYDTYYDDDFDWDDEDELDNPYDESYSVSESLDGTISISGERTYDGVHYYVLSTDFPVDDVSVAHSLESQLGFPVHQMGYSDCVWVQADKSDLEDLQTAVDNFNGNSLSESYLKEDRYIDANGVMGDVGETWTVADLRNYWDEEKDYDSVLQDYDSFDSWVTDTINLMEPIEGTIEPEEDCYIDTSGIMGDFGDTWTVSQLRNYWNEESEYDPVLQGYDSFDSWLSDTISQMEPMQESLTESQDEELTTWVGKYFTKNRKAKKVYFQIPVSEEDMDYVEELFREQMPKPYVSARLIGTDSDTPDELEDQGFTRIDINVNMDNLTKSVAGGNSDSFRNSDFADITKADARAFVTEFEDRKASYQHKYDAEKEAAQTRANTRIEQYKEEHNGHIRPDIKFRIEDEEFSKARAISQDYTNNSFDDCERIREVGNAYDALQPGVYKTIENLYDSSNGLEESLVIKNNPISNTEESLTESNDIDYKVGDVITFDGNIHGVTPRIGKGTILSIGRGLAGHGDPNPGRVFKIKGENGRTFSIDETQIVTESTYDDFDGEYGNTISNELPADVDIFLMDFAQVYGGIDYNNIADLGAVWELLPEKTIDAIYQTINQIEEACDDTGLDCYETAQEYGDVRDDCERLIQLVKGHEKF